jgi:hypothetical protein
MGNRDELCALFEVHPAVGAPEAQVPGRTLNRKTR